MGSRDLWFWDQMPDRSKLWEERDAYFGSWFRNTVRNCGKDTVVEVCQSVAVAGAAAGRAGEGLGQRRCRSFSSRDVCLETDSMQHQM